MKYQNIAFSADKAQFIDAVTNTAGPNGLIFTNMVKQAPLAGGAKAQMVNGSITINQPTSVVSSDSTTVLNESLKLQWNFTRASTAKLAAMRVEMLRCFDEAVAQHNLAMGLVPPVYVTFESI